MNDESIFDHAREMTDAAERARFLDSACAGNAALRREVESLLAAHFAASNPLDSGPATGEYKSGSVADASGSAGLKIGPYKLLQKLGEGGMGEVWMAEQEEPVRRRVALKLIKAGMDSAQVIARFEAERQALALMDHPNIAKILDAGITNEPRTTVSGTTEPLTAVRGSPYFVMELVKGIPITKFCDQEHLTPRERLELFIPVCQAVQHAHQKGIIHRDLKPSNIIIGLYDGKPVPKVIDFGVAKATQQRLTERTMFTEAGSIVGTLEYMAPEQAELNNLDIDTRSDIYALGVLLYELLAGSPPFTGKQLRGAAFTEMLRMIREVEPPKPSTRLSSSDELPSIAANRKLEPQRLTKQVSGDLDWIVMKALEKDRARRYESANDFAMDIQRFLADEAVLACPPSSLYRFKKFVRRNKAPVFAAASLLFVTTIGIVGTSIGMTQALRASRSAQAAHEHTRQALDDMTSGLAQQWLVSQPKLNPDQKRFLNSVTRYYEEFAAESPVDEKAQSRIINALGRLGQMQRGLGRLIESEMALDRGLVIAEPLAKQFPINLTFQSDHAKILNELALTRAYRGNWAEAERTYYQSLSIFESVLNQAPRDVNHRTNLGVANGSLGGWLDTFHRHAEAEACFRRATEINASLTNEFPDNTEYLCREVQSLNGLGHQLRQLGRMDEAERALRKGLAINERILQLYPHHAPYRVALARSNVRLGELLREPKNAQEGERAYRQALTIFNGLVNEFPGDPDHRSDYASSICSFGGFLMEKERWPEAEDMYRHGHAVAVRLCADFPDAPFNSAGVLENSLNLANMISDKKGQPSEAIEIYRQAIAAGEMLVKSKEIPFGVRHDLSIVYSNMAILLRNMNSLDDSERFHRKAIAMMEQLLTEAPGERTYRVTLAEDYGHLAGTLHGQRRNDEAEALYYRGLETLRTTSSDDSKSFVCHNMLAQLNLDYGTLVRKLRGPAEAEKYLLTAVRHYEAMVALHPESVHTGVRLACALAKAGNHGRASEQAERLLRNFNLPGSDIYNMVCIFALGASSADPAAAEKSAMRAMELLQQAAEAGFFADGGNISYLHNDPDLNALQARPDFRAFLAKLENEKPGSKPPTRQGGGGPAGVD